MLHGDRISPSGFVGLAGQLRRTRLALVRLHAVLAKETRVQFHNNG